MAAPIDPMQLLGSMTSTMGFLAEKADEREYLKRVNVDLQCTVLKDSVERFYRSGKNAGQLRGHQTNLTTDEGDILQDIMVDAPLTKGEIAWVTVELLIPDNFLQGKVKISGNGELAKELAGMKGGRSPLPTSSPKPPESPKVPGAMDMGGKP